MRELIILAENLNSITQPLANFDENIQEEALNFFKILADSQRGKPEILATSMTANKDLFNATGAFTFLAEHIGDLTHRMAQKYCEKMRFGFENVHEKVRKALRYFGNGYGLEREMNDNLKNNFKYRTETTDLDISYEQFVSDFKKGAKKYADAHAELIVWNDAQWHARQAAVSLGNMDFRSLELHLKTLWNHLQSDDDWIDYASQITISDNKIIPYRSQL